MNELAREALRERIGEELVYATDFGERTFGIGDVLVGRERAHGAVDGICTRSPGIAMMGGAPQRALRAVFRKGSDDHSARP